MSDNLAPTTFVLPQKTNRSCTESTKKMPDPAIALDERRQAALSEIQLFRSTLQSLEARLPQIEFFIANAATNSDSTGLDDQDGDGQEGSVVAGSDNVSERAKLVQDRMNQIVRSFGNPITSVNVPTNVLASSATPYGSGISPALDQRARKRFKHDHDSTDSQDEGSEAVEASALGRPRNAEDQQTTSATATSTSVPQIAPGAIPTPSILAKPDAEPSPIVAYPDAASFMTAAPTFDEEEVILNRGRAFSWHHSVIHMPTWSQQVHDFWELGEARFERASAAWLSLYFAVLAISTKLLDEEEQLALGWSEAQTSATACKFFDCSVSCLYRQNFLANYDFFTLQAIALLVIGGRDTGSAALIANLLASGLSVAQDLNLHRQCSDAEWDSKMKDQPEDVRSRALIDRETRKRTLYAMCYSDWFAAPFRSSWILGRARIKTPLPLNCTDGDLAQGKVVNRPMSEYTNVSWLLMYINLATCMQVAFEHSSGSRQGEVDYEAFLQIDNQLEAILADLPPWLKKDGDASGAPQDFVQMMRSTFFITAQHKILSIHRPFLAKKNKSAHSFSRRRVVMAARAILQEAPKVRRNRIWTVLYHLSVALFSVTLELFEQVKQPMAEADTMRQEIDVAVSVLEELKHSSSIADRGLRLVMPLLQEERKMSAEAAKRRARKPRKSNPIPTENGAESSSAVTLNSQPVTAITTPTSDTQGRAESIGSATGQALPSPEIPSWYLGDDNWLDDQLTGTQATTPASFDPLSASTMYPMSMPPHVAGYTGVVMPYGLVPLPTMHHPHHHPAQMTMAPPYGVLYPPGYNGSPWESWTNHSA
ncbi:hypothetical protein OIV83_004751 [Microbotryomycetes sp. JL201]|nr:hypothetical protein OIV83_004751 [Microbotryomycetes sp. JL201]